jgi:hypothetical protein
MNAIIDLLERTRGTIFTNEDGIESSFSLLPPLSNEELAALQEKLPCKIPDDMLEVFRFARGFEGGSLENVDFSGYGFGWEEMIPHGVELAADGFGNSWIVDLTEESTSWGPILYACHDAPVLVYQCDTLLHFIEEVFRFGRAPFQSEINDVHEQYSDRIWKQNPGLLLPAECADSADHDLREFASMLDESWFICDMRHAKMGDGFYWGRYGPKTPIKRFGKKRLFAYRKQNWGKRLRDAFF